MNWSIRSIKIRGYEHIIGLHDLMIHNYGESKIHASVHCEVPAELDVLISHSVIDKIERDFLKDMNIHLIIHLDPVITNDETNDLKSRWNRPLPGFHQTFTSTIFGWWDITIPI